MPKLWTLLNSQPQINDGLYGSSGSRANVPLNSAFVYNTSGAAIGIVLRCPTNEPINELYVFNDLVNGTPASTTLECTVRNTGPSVSRPGGTVYATSTAVDYPATSDTWIRFTFGTPYTPAINELLWLVIANTSTSPTVNFPSILTATNTIFRVQLPQSGFSSTVGFSANGTAQTELPCVIKFGDDYMGQPFTQYGSSNALSVSNGAFRGILVADAFKNYPFITINTVVTNHDRFQIFQSGQIATDTPIWQSGPALNMSTRPVWFAPQQSLGAGVNGPFRVGFTITNTTNVMEHAQIEDYSRYPAVFNYFYDLWGLCPITHWNGSSWVDDYSRTPQMSIGFDPAAVSSGGGLKFFGGFDGGYGG